MWMKYRIVWRHGYGKWDWHWLSEKPIPMGTAQEYAESFEAEVTTEHYYNEGYRGIQYTIHEKPPEEYVKKRIEATHSQIARLTSTISSLEQYL